MSDDQNPVDEALDAKEKVAAQRRAKDTQMWQQWKADPTPDTLRPLMKRFEPILRSKVQMWKAPGVNEAAMKANLRIHAMDALKTFDPTKAGLRTHLENRLKKSMRFNVQQQNLAYIPEAKAGRIGDIQQATDALTEDLGRPPTPMEISNFLNPNLSARQQLTPKRVQQIQQAQIGDVIGSSFESDPVPKAISREREVVGLLRPALSADQQAVYDHLYGLNGKQKTTSTTQLAKLLGKSPSQVSRLRTAILGKFKEFK
jgi:DNA-directed RNA polymerase specialized sigma subunit